MAKKFLDNTGLSHLINLIQGMPDDQTIGYTTETGLHVLGGGITPDKISSLQQLRYEMGLGNTLGALPIENGGTGATNAEGAIENLGLEEYILNLINTSGSGGEMKPYLVMNITRSVEGEVEDKTISIDSYGFAGYAYTGEDKALDLIVITSSVTGTFNVSYRYYNPKNGQYESKNETWHATPGDSKEIKIDRLESSSKVGQINTLAIYPV